MEIVQRTYRVCGYVECRRDPLARPGPTSPCYQVRGETLSPGLRSMRADNPLPLAVAFRPCSGRHLWHLPGTHPAATHSPANPGRDVTAGRLATARPGDFPDGKATRSSRTPHRVTTHIDCTQWSSIAPERKPGTRSVAMTGFTGGSNRIPVPCLLTRQTERNST